MNDVGVIFVNGIYVLLRLAECIVTTLHLAAVSAISRRRWRRRNAAVVSCVSHVTVTLRVTVKEVIDMLLYYSSLYCPV